MVLINIYVILVEFTCDILFWVYWLSCLSRKRGFYMLLGADSFDKWFQ